MVDQQQQQRQIGIRTLMAVVEGRTAAGGHDQGRTTSVVTTMLQHRRQQQRRRQQHPQVLTLVLLLVAAATTTTTIPTMVNGERILRQVQVITRHGARTPLQKSSTSLTESGGATLTPLGQLQHYDLGIWLMNRYQGQNIIDTYNATSVHLESSHYERTVTSANSLALGLFPRASRDPHEENLLQDWFGNPILPANVPVYTKERRNDVTIRAYDKCPTFHTKLNQLYESDSWLKEERSNEELLHKLATIDAFGGYATGNYPNVGSGQRPIVPLKDIWNVYDAIHVAKTECANVDLGGEDGNGGLDAATLLRSRACQELPDRTIIDALTDREWEELKELAHTAELAKYASPTTAGTLIGGNLLLQIYQRIVGDTMVDLDLNPGGDAGNDRLRRQLQSPSVSWPIKNFYLYSAHYPTILGLFAAMGQSPPSNSKVIPDYASALIVELYDGNHDDDIFDGDEPTIRILYKSGFDDNDAIPIELGNGENGCESGEVYCPLSWFSQTIVSTLGYISPEEWCLKCRNVGADVCMDGTLGRLGLDDERSASVMSLDDVCSDQQSSNGNKKKIKFAIAMAFFGGAAVGLGIMFLMLSFCPNASPCCSRGDGGVTSGVVVGKNGASSNGVTGTAENAEPEITPSAVGVTA